jgi:tetratricopeptide (TPR) repeat protein
VKRISRGQTLALWERYLERALAEVDKGEKANLDNAMLDINAAIDHAPRMGELYATRALISYLQNKPDAEVDADLKLAFGIDRHQWLCLYVWGLMAMRKQNYPEAVESFSQAQRYVPTRPEVLQARAMAYYGQGELDRAILDIELALKNAEDRHAKDLKKMLNDFKSRQKS